jgi:hypothetical protein
MAIKEKHLGSWPRQCIRCLNPGLNVLIFKRITRSSEKIFKTDHVKLLQPISTKIGAPVSDQVSRQIRVRSRIDIHRKVMLMGASQSVVV